MGFEHRKKKILEKYCGWDICYSNNLYWCHKKNKFSGKYALISCVYRYIEKKEKVKIKISSYH